jgi:hypothetical protein
MAQLHTEKEKYGVSVAARIDPQMAQQILKRAERLGLSFAKMVSMIISQGFNPPESFYSESLEDFKALEEQVSILKSDLIETQRLLNAQSSLYKRTAAQFIDEITENQEEQIRFSQIYNQVLSDLKQQEA